MKNLSIPKATSPLATWLYYLEHLHSSAIDLGLERARRVAEKLDLLQPAPYIFTVAGTNGKGTTCCTLEAILIAAGLRVGVYSSPHLLRYTERVRIQGQELAESQHSQALSYIEQGRGDISLSYFEFGTLSAFKLFQQAQLDVVILEVGLGGRLDATNIVDANVAVITSIAIDHTDWLGSDRESIGREKAGIFRCDRPAIVGEPDMPQSIADYAHAIGAQLQQRDQQWLYQSTQQNWCWQTIPADTQSSDNYQSYSDLPLTKIPLANAATALAALHYSELVISEQAIRQGLVNASLPGRFQMICQSPRLILDVAHNPHAAAYLAERLAELSVVKGAKARAVVGMLNDKDISGTLALLRDRIDVWYCAPLEGPRGTTIEQIAEHLPSPYCFASVELAWKQAMLDALSDDIVVVFGSFHTVAQVMAALEKEKVDGQ